MIVRRLCRAAHRALDGEGALRVGGRWNRPGLAAVYTSTTLSLAALEYLVHLEIPLAPNDLVALTIEVPDPVIDTLDPATLPSRWRRIPAHPWCAERGSQWLTSGTAVGLLVPSAVIPEEQNLILNPAHPAFAQVQVVGERRFTFDPRLRKS